MLPLLQTVLFTLLVLPIRENHAQGFPQVLEYEHENKIVRKNITDVWIEMIPDVKERVIEHSSGNILMQDAFLPARSTYEICVLKINSILTISSC